MSFTRNNINTVGKMAVNTSPVIRPVQSAKIATAKIIKPKKVVLKFLNRRSINKRLLLIK